MSNANEPEVKDVDTIYVEPAGKDAENVDADSTEPESSPDENAAEPEEGAEPAEAESDAAKGAEPAPAAPAANTKVQAPIKQIPGETPREFAMRQEITRLKRLGRNDRTQSILGGQPPVVAPAAQKEMSPEKKKILEKYKPEEIGALREVIDVMAEDMGFVRKDQLGVTSYQEKASEELDKFLEKHPEYLPENDPENVLWGSFQREFGMFAKPNNPKDLKKILERVHREVFGIQPAAALKSSTAAREKVKVASHAGASRPRTEGIARRTAAPAGLRTDMLKGFSDEEKAELERGE